MIEKIPIGPFYRYKKMWNLTVFAYKKSLESVFENLFCLIVKMRWKGKSNGSTCVFACNVGKVVWIITLSVSASFLLHGPQFVMHPPYNPHSPFIINNSFTTKPNQKTTNFFTTLPLFFFSQVTYGALDYINSIVYCYESSKLWMK